jgi:DNA-binding NarL/FixJ family response regulator
MLLAERGTCSRNFLSRKTIESHISQIFVKLDLRDSPDGHRRVLAILTFLRST